MTKQMLDQLVKEAQHATPVGNIGNGTVIDHIHKGMATHLIDLLQLDDGKHVMTVGVNLGSKRLGCKDIIKIEGRHLSRNIVQHIAVFAPAVTINIIKEFRVVEKIIPQVPDSLSGIIKCPNSHCITNYEHAKTVFEVITIKEKQCLRCHHCEKVFALDQIRFHYKEPVHA